MPQTDAHRISQFAGLTESEYRAAVAAILDRLVKGWAAFAAKRGVA